MHDEDSPFVFIMKNALSILLLLILSFSLHAQGVDDAVLNSQTFYEGTARSMAMGNATGAMGGDFTATCINPAGLGLYRTSEFTFSTGLQHTLFHSNYYDNNQFAGKTRMSVPNFGLVMGGEVSNYKPLRYIMLGFGLTRTNDFNYRTHAKGLNPGSSMVDAYIQTADGIDELFNPSTNVGDYLYDNYPYDLSPAWETFLIDRFTDSLGNLFFNSPVPQGDVCQSDAITSKGRSEEWTLALAANYYDKLFIGSSIGFTHIKRISTREYQETPASSNYDFFQWGHQEDLSDTAWGVNFKCGLIYFPTSWLRIGAAWHSRSLYAIGEDWSTETYTSLKDSHGAEDYHKYLSPTLYQSYEFHTPHTLVGSATFFVGRNGMVNTDVEYMNYGDSKFTSYDYDFSDANQDIRNMLKPTFNLRVGTEWRMRQYFIRGGAAYYGSPYGFGENYGSVKKMALGIGYAIDEDAYWDFAYELTESTTGYTPYRFYVDGQNVVDNIVQHRWRNKFVVTLKVKME